MSDQFVIRFYGKSLPNFWCSNFSPDPFMLHGELWLTSEHLYQALKHSTVDGAWAAQIRDAKTPGQSRKMAWAEGHPPREDWDQVKDDAMRLSVLCKFVGNGRLEQLLLSTGDRLLIEASPIDYYWGEGNDGTGKNMLGQVLMEVRDLLRRGGSGLAHAKMMILIGRFRDDLRLIK